MKLWKQGESRKRLHGVHTVEASFVVLISLFTVFLMIFLGFYYHDRQCLDAELHRLSNRGAAEGWSISQLEEEVRECLAQKTIPLLLLQVQTIQRSEKRVEVQVYFPILTSFSDLWRREDRRECVSVTIESFFPEQRMRQAAVLDLR